MNINIIDLLNFHISIIKNIYDEESKFYIGAVTNSIFIE